MKPGINDPMYEYVKWGERQKKLAHELLVARRITRKEYLYVMRGNAVLSYKVITVYSPDGTRLLYTDELFPNRVETIRINRLLGQEDIDK